MEQKIGLFNVFPSKMKLENVFLFLRILGLTPIKVVKKGDLFFEISYLSFLYGMILFVMIIMSLFSEFQTIMESDLYVQVSGHVMYFIEAVTISITCLFGITLGLLNHKKAISVFVRLDRISKPIGHLMGDLNWFGWISFAHIVYQNLVVFYDACVYSDVYEGLDWSYVTMYITYNVALGMVLMFSFQVVYLHEHIKALNSFYSQILNRLYPKYNRLNVANYAKNVRALQTLNSYFENLMEIVEEISEQNGKQILCLLVYFLEQLVSSSFFAIMNEKLFRPNQFDRFHFIVLHALWTACGFFQLMIILWSCTRLKNEVNSLRIKISRHLNPFGNDEGQKQIELTLLKMDNKYSGFSACGFIELDMSTAVGMLATSMTYLIIFLQF